MEFTREIPTAASPEGVWALLWDVERLARCIPGCQSARAVEPPVRYEATVAERVGPFKVTFPLDIEVLEAQAPKRLRAKATGRDASVGSSLQLQLDLAIEPAGDRTVLRLRAEVSVLGKLAALGGGMIRRKADEIMDRFAQALRRELDGDRADAPTV
ncbi:MAG: SRPBCC family protein [Candidatus Rokubacteria bacterium]|nr:SRPBCC family protein [Candidatus Rokubacteria bacterium]